MDVISIERSMGDQLHEQQVIHLFKLVISHNQPIHGRNMRIMDETLRHVIITLILLDETLRQVIVTLFLLGGTLR